MVPETFFPLCAVNWHGWNNYWFQRNVYQCPLEQRVQAAVCNCWIDGFIVSCGLQGTTLSGHTIPASAQLCSCTLPALFLQTMDAVIPALWMKLWFFFFPWKRKKILPLVLSFAYNFWPSYFTILELFEVVGLGFFLVFFQLLFCPYSVCSPTRHLKWKYLY